MGTEIELKLGVDRTGLQRLKRHPLVLRLKVGRATTRTLTSVYFDTPDLLLNRHQAVLRVRHLGTRRIQTVKTYGPSAWARGEWEYDIAGDKPDLGALDGAGLDEPFDRKDWVPALVPVFATQVKRTALHLKTPEGEVELALDEGQLIAGAAQETISEAEIELLTGTPAALFKLALALHDDVPFRLTSITKAERGYNLFARTLPKPRKAEDVTLAEDLSTAAAFQAIARSCVAQMLTNQDCLEVTGDAEAVHQMRVGLRRLRSAMNLFKTIVGGPEMEALREELRWLQGHLGPARDTDVFISEILDPLVETFAEEPGFHALTESFGAERGANYAVARQVLGQPRYTRLMLNLGLWIEGGAWLSGDNRIALDAPIPTLADAILRKRDKQARKSLKHLRTLDPHTRHLGRIQIKKLRYAVEFFAALYSTAKVRRAVSVLGQLQDTLGLLNDIAVSRDLLRQRAEGTGDSSRLWAAGLIAGWHAARVPPLLEQAVVQLKVYKNQDWPWRA